MIQIKDSEMHMLTEFIQSKFGINLTEKKNLVEGRLAKVLMDRGMESFNDYFSVVKNDRTGEEVALLIDRLTTNHTFFMREVSHFDYFRDTVMPWLVKTVTDRDLRIWSAGCSTGEEAYTLAMIMADHMERESLFWDMKILATDISYSVLQSAREGVYTAEEVSTLPKIWQQKYFRKEANERFRVTESIRNQVIFRSYNLMEPILPFKKPFHVIFCRNVMIYFNQETKDQLVHRYYNHTVPGGYLFIGHSESLGRDSREYRYIMPSVYRK